MITLIFKEKGEAGVHAFGFATLGYKSSDDTEILKELEEEELQILLGQDRQDNIYRLKLENGEIVLNEKAVEIFK